MGYEPVSEQAKYSTAIGGFNKKLNKPNPTQLEGYYMGSREIDSAKSKTGKAFVHRLDTKDGLVDVWGKTNLDRQMQSAKIGLMTLITQNGMAPTKNGEMYVYKVLQDKTNVRPEEEYAPASSYEEVEEAPSEEDEPAPARPVAPRVAAQTTSAAASKVQALLSARASKAV